MNRARKLLFGVAAIALVLGCSLTQKTVETTPAPTMPPLETPDTVIDLTPVPTEVPTPIPTPTPSPTPTPTPTPSPTPEPDGLIGWSIGGFVPKEETTLTEDSFVNDRMHITVTKYTDTEHYSGTVTYFVADVYVRDVTDIRTASAGGFNKHKEEFVDVMAQDNDALFAITGDYYGHHTHSLVIRNGVVYDKKLYSNWDLCFLYRDGTVETMPSDQYSAKNLREDIWQAWQFGPSLLDAEGHALEDFPKSSIRVGNPRTVFGYYEPGHYCFVTVDGRQGKNYSIGMTLSELAKLMESLGCKIAFNLDGGESAVLYWNGAVYNSPYNGGRRISDIIYLRTEN